MQPQAGGGAAFEFAVDAGADGDVERGGDANDVVAGVVGGGVGEGGAVDGVAEGLGDADAGLVFERC